MYSVLQVFYLNVCTHSLSFSGKESNIGSGCVFQKSGRIRTVVKNISLTLI